MGSQSQRAGQHVECLRLAWDSFGRHTGYCRFISSCDMGRVWLCFVWYVLPVYNYTCFVQCMVMLLVDSK